MTEDRGRGMKFPVLCSGEPVDGGGYLVDGVTDEQHQWVEGASYEGPGPVGEAPVRWEELQCERCGAINYGWRPTEPA